MFDSTLETISTALSVVIMIVALFVWIMKGKKVPKGKVGSFIFYVLFIGAVWALSIGIHWLLGKITG